MKKTTTTFMRWGATALTGFLLSTSPQGLMADSSPGGLLSEPFLNLPTEETVTVAWFTEYEGQNHYVDVGEEGDTTRFQATTTRMTRMFEDGGSDLFDAEGERLYDSFTERPVWRHSAVITGLEPGVRVPYSVSSVAQSGATYTSGTYTLQAAPEPGQPVKIVLTSDQQNRAMSPGTFQKLVETVGTPDAILFAGDFVDNPHRASEWFDRDNEGRPAFFPSLQGTFQELFPDHPYTGGAVLQHAPTFGTIGNHESPGRFSKHAEEQASINAVDGDPQPRWYAELRYEREVLAGNIIPPEDPEERATFREDFIRQWSFEHTTYYEMWDHPDDGPQGESYYALQYGDVFIISMNVSRVWRNWNPGRGKFSESAANLNNPDEWGFGDMFFEYYAVGTEQYEWLQGVLESEDFQNAKYKVVMGHQTMFGLGDNSLPVMADPVATITYLDEEGNEQQMQRTWPADAATFATDILPLVEREAITDIFYEYPIENDIWQNDIEPLLQKHGVQLVHTGHSHLWNRAQVGHLHYIETSNYGNSFGVGYEDDNVSIQRAPWARFPGDPRGGFVEGPDPADTPRFGDAQDRQPAYPTIENPEHFFGETTFDVPYVSSNNLGVFTILDTADGAVRSYAYDWRDPEGEVILFDEFFLEEAFRVKPYLTAPTEEGITITWFADEPFESSIAISGGDLDEPMNMEVTPVNMTDTLGYSEAEEAGRSDPRLAGMFQNANYKYQVVLTGLSAGTSYDYTVTLRERSLAATFDTAPARDTMEPIRFIVHADSETEPDTRNRPRDWTLGPQATGSTGRPADLPKDGSGRDLYLFSQGDGFANNIAIWKERQPDFIVMPGDLVQGGNYQRGWDEFFRHLAGERDDPLTTTPILPALGNWENFGALNGGYQPQAVYEARQRFKAYFDKPSNGTPEHQNQYYRIDYGPVTILTLDSSNGEPDGNRPGRAGNLFDPSASDTQENVNTTTYPGNDLADFNPGSVQYAWVEEQLQDAREKGQIIFAQFHHVPYSSGTHSAPMTALGSEGNALPGNSGQAGTPMRVYSPLFEKYGVVAVFSGHSEMFERSVVNGIHYYDVGVAGDGMRGPLSAEDAANNNPFSAWLAHWDAPELWSGNRLLAGGKHYGHLEVTVTPLENGEYEVTMVPVHAFPLMDTNMNVYGFERREYNDTVTQTVSFSEFVEDPFATHIGADSVAVQLAAWTESPASASLWKDGEIVESADTVPSDEGDPYVHTATFTGLSAESDYVVRIEINGETRDLAFTTARFFLSEPMLQLPLPGEVTVVWYTEFEGEDHRLVYGNNLERTAVATTTRVSRSFEDGGSDKWVYRADGSRSRMYGSFTERPVWRHEATATGLTAGVRVPYHVESSNGIEIRQSAEYTLQGAPAAGMPTKILLTSDQQNRTMSPATFQKVEETLGMVDLVLFAGDYVDNPHRASEWFDRDNPNRPAFFPSLQGTYQELHPDWPYRGGAILQHAPVHGVIGNHETPGRFGKHVEEQASINAVDGDPQPRWYAELRYERAVAAGDITPPSDPAEAAAFREDYIRDWSYEFTAFLEMWNHPDAGPRGEEYWSMSYGDTFIIGMNVSRVWRNWNPGRGKFSESASNLNNPDEWGFGDMFFEYYGEGTTQYDWLVEQLQSKEAQNARYRIVLGHQTMFGLGDNSLPVMADPVMTITYTDANGNSQQMVKVWPDDADSFESDVRPLAEAGVITDVYYEYPIEEDTWLTDIEPLLLEHDVHMVHTGHSHLWNRTIVDGQLHYIETSNYGNSFGAGLEGFAVRAPWARFPGDANSVFGPDPMDTPRTGDAHGRLPVFPTLENVTETIEGRGVWPVVASNRIGVFTVFDTETGMVESYAFDTSDPESDVVLFDAFPMDLDRDPVIFPFAYTVGGWKQVEGMGWVHESVGSWVYSPEHEWLFFDVDYEGMYELRFWESSLGWMVSSGNLLPLMYSTEREAWLYHLQGSDPRLFYDLESGEWLEM